MKLLLSSLMPSKIFIDFEICKYGVCSLSLWEQTLFYRNYEENQTIEISRLWLSSTYYGGADGGNYRGEILW